MLVQDVAGIKSEEMEQSPATPSSASKMKQAHAKTSATPGASTARRGKGGPENKHHNYRGVQQHRWGKWVAEIHEPNRGRRHWLGTFDTVVDAALAYDRAAMAINGPGALVNFPSHSIAATAAPEQCEPASCSPSADAVGAASVFDEHEVKPLAAHGGGGGVGIAQHWDASCAAHDEMFADIAMFIDIDPVAEMLAYHPDIKSEDCKVDDGLDTDVVDSPLWALDD